MHSTFEICKIYSCINHIYWSDWGQNYATMIKWLPPEFIMRLSIAIKYLKHKVNCSLYIKKCFSLAKSINIRSKMTLHIAVLTTDTRWEILFFQGSPWVRRYWRAIILYSIKNALNLKLCLWTWNIKNSILFHNYYCYNCSIIAFYYFTFL